MCYTMAMAGKGKVAGTGRPRKMEGPPRKRVLFFCACNSIRSQMAEGLLRAFRGDRYEVYSAGLRPTHLSPVAVRVMAELGIDISGQTAKGVETFVGTYFDCVATVCGDPKGPCPFLTAGQEGFTCRGCAGCCAFHPFFPAGKRSIHGCFTEPAGRGEEAEAFRRVRDELRDWIEKNF